MAQQGPGLVRLERAALVGLIAGRARRLEAERSLDELEKLSHAETKKIEDLSATKEREVMEL